MQNFKTRMGVPVQAYETDAPYVTIVVTRDPFSGKENQRKLHVTMEDLEKYYSFKYKVQELFPQLSDSDREFLISGITDESWEDAFGSDLE